MKTLKRSTIPSCRFIIVIAIVFSSITSKGQTTLIERVFDKSLAQTSYIITNSDTKEAIVIDPKRDIDTYLDITQQKGIKIKYVTETHIHADFLSGSRELALATGAELLLSGETEQNWGYEFAHTPIKDGYKIKLGKLVIEVMHTPGHTPESLTFILTDTLLSDKPQKAFTGDFVFVGDVGRPDLLEKVAGQAGSQTKGAKQLFSSIQRFSKLPDDLEIWPGHGAGSFCGKSLSDIPQSTLGQEKRQSKAFSDLNDEQGFIKYVLEGQPAPPKYFAVMKDWNREPRSLLIEVPKHTQLTSEEFSSALKNGVAVIDTRKKEVVAKGFIPGSIHIEGGNSFSTFMGWLFDYQQQYILIAEEGQIEDLTRKLMRIGMDNMYGYVTNLNGLGQKLATSNVVDAPYLKKSAGKEGIQIIDVRNDYEFASGHVTGAKNIALAALEQNLDKVDKDKQVIVHCKSGTRAAMAYSILSKNGYENIRIYMGDIKPIIEQPAKPKQ
jgi:hydroxyacylglutathione hydrolase